MTIIANLLVGAIALLHLYILVLEMFLWTTPQGQKAFGINPDFARQTRALAANQGLYNGFLAAGLVWGLLQPDEVLAWQIKVFFLACIAAAGIFGAATAKRSILFVQTVPAVIAILLVVFGG
jgi:putative membrane protein